MSIELLNDRIAVIKTLASLHVVHNKECPEAEYLDEYSFSQVKRKGVLFNIDLACECNGYDNKGNKHYEWVKHERHNIAVIVAKPHNVYVNLSNTKSLADYKNSSNHSSCWGYDGLSLIWDFALDMYHRVYANKPKDKRPNMVNADFLIWDSFNTFMQPVEITTKSIEDGYHGNITNIQSIHMTELYKGGTK